MNLYPDSAVPIILWTPKNKGRPPTVVTYEELEHPPGSPKLCVIINEKYYERAEIQALGELICTAGLARALVEWPGAPALLLSQEDFDKRCRHRMRSQSAERRRVVPKVESKQ